MYFFTTLSELCKDLCSYFWKSKIIIIWGIWQRSFKKKVIACWKNMSDLFSDGFLILLGGHAADLAALMCSSMCSTVRAISWLLVYSGCCILAKWILLSSAQISEERLLIDISQLSASQFKEMAKKGCSQQKLVAFCWWGQSAPILSLEASRHTSKGSLLKLWD